MDERVEKAFQITNYFATLASQKKIILEELDQKLIHYHNGGTFKITPELITFTKILLDKNITTGVAILDDNNIPIPVDDVTQFHDTIFSVYFEAVNEYSVKYSEIKSKRKVKDLIDL
jgi:beta-galactosidase GanA